MRIVLMMMLMLAVCLPVPAADRKYTEDEAFKACSLVILKGSISDVDYNTDSTFIQITYVKGNNRYHVAISPNRKRVALYMGMELLLAVDKDRPDLYDKLAALLLTREADIRKWSQEDKDRKNSAVSALVKE